MQHPAAPLALVLGLDPNETPLISVTPLVGELPDAAPVVLSAEAQAAIGALLQLVPGGVGVAASTSGAYVLRFAPHLSAPLATGQATLMQAVEGGARAIAVDAQGTILGHGTLIPLTGLNPALAAAALWQVAAVATAQHYLVAMQRQLAQVESAVGELRDWLQDRELAGLVTNARFLQDALSMHALAAEHAGEAQAVPQIAQIAREAAGVVEARRMSLARTAAQVQTVPLADPIWWNVARNVASFRATLAAANHDARVGAMGLAVWGSAVQVRQMLIGRSHQAEGERRRIAEARAQLGDAHRLVNDAAHARIAAITSRSDVRHVLLSLQALAHAEIAAGAHQCEADLAQIDQALALRGDQAAAPQPDAPHQLVARRASDESWACTAYHPPVTKALPAPARVTADVLNRLLHVPGFMLASLADAGSAKLRFTLCNGLALASWRNIAGLNHVFVTDRTGRAIFGGCVGWNNGPLEDAIREIGRRYA